MLSKLRDKLLSQRASLIACGLVVLDQAISAYFQIAGRTRPFFSPLTGFEPVKVVDLVICFVLTSYLLWRGLRKPPSRATVAGLLAELMCVFIGTGVLLFLLQYLMQPIWILSVIPVPLGI